MDFVDGAIALPFLRHSLEPQSRLLSVASPSTRSQTTLPASSLCSRFDGFTTPPDGRKARPSEP